MNGPEHGMSLIVKTVARLTTGLILIYGLHIIAHGHLSPGGGFAGGVILALAAIQLLLAYGASAFRLRRSLRLAEIAEGLGALLFVGIALAGIAAGAFFLNFPEPGTPFRLASAGTIPLSNLAIGIKVGAGLTAIMLALVLFQPAPEDTP